MSASVVAPVPAAEEPARQAEWVRPTWEEVVTNHSAKVYRLAYRLTGNKYDAEDLTQEVFVRVFRSLENFKPGTLDGWLHRITTNLFLDQARRKSRIRFDALAEDAEARLPGRDPGPEQASNSTTWTSTSRPPWRNCPRTSAPPSCSATWRGCPTTRWPWPWASSWEPSGPASTGAGPCSVKSSRTGIRRPKQARAPAQDAAHRGPPLIAPWVAETRAARTMDGH